MFQRTRICRAALAAIGGVVVLGTPVAVYAVDRVEITGSAIRRVDAETALPVQVITKEEISRSGVTSVEQLLANISALSSAGGTASSEGAGSTTYGNSTISLRGLEDSRTLVLVNGRRLATFADGSAAVNVNVIPLAAIERVEVLKDGASSTYGSDAMAGVVNFILTKSMSGVEVSAYAGSPLASGGGNITRAAITGGFGEGGMFRGVVSATIEKQTPLFGRDRSYTESAINLPFYTSGATGQGNIEGAVFPGQYPNDRQPNFGTSPATGYGNPLAEAGRCADINMALNPTRTNKISPVTGLGAPFCAFDTGSFVGLIPKKDLRTLTGNFGIQLTPDHEVFADLLWSRSEVQTTYQTPPLRRGFAAPSNTRLLGEGVDPSLIIFPTNPNYRIASDYLTALGYTALVGQPLAITSRVFDFGGRQVTDTATQTRVVVGARGVVLGQDYEFAFSSNQSKLAGKWTGGVFSVTEYNRIINDSDWNPWAPGGVQTGALAERLQAAAYVGPSLDAKAKNSGFDSVLSGEAFAVPAGAAMYAVGFQTRKESIERNPAPAPGSGDIAGAGGAAFAIDRDRTTRAVFGELTVPVTKEVEATFSLRHDRYSDFGTTNNYKVSASWRPMSTVLVRASHNTGFRAPTLPELWQPQIAGTSEQFDDPGTGQTDLQVSSITGGNPDLKPETSSASTIGIVLSPTRDFSVGMDLFRIRINDIIQTPGAQEIVSRFRAGDAAFQDLVILNGNDIDTIKSVTSNLGTAKVRGLDVFATYKLNAGPGRLDLGMSGTFMDQFDQTSPSGKVSQKVGTEVEPDGTPVIGGDEGGVILRWKHTFAVAYTMGDWSASMIQNFTKGYRAGNDLNDNPTRVGSYSIIDLSLSYKGFAGLTLTGGMKNAGDKVPGTYVPSSNQFQSGYDVTMFDPRGRTVFVEARYKF